jgi:hypothetical protein
MRRRKYKNRTNSHHASSAVLPHKKQQEKNKKKEKRKKPERLPRFIMIIHCMRVGAGIQSPRNTREWKYEMKR